METFLGVFGGDLAPKKKSPTFFRGISWNSMESRGISWRIFLGVFGVIWGKKNPKIANFFPWSLVEFRGTFLAQKRFACALCESLLRFGPFGRQSWL